MTLALTGRIGWRHVPPVAVRAGGVAAPGFRRAATAGGQLRAAGADRDRAGDSPSSSDGEPACPLAPRAYARRGRWQKLIRLQPENGGFLEATPLTSFVTMSLAAMGLHDHVVARRGADFLRASVRADGSWAIDTNLATWVTTLAIKALAPQAGVLTPEQRLTLREWLLGQQYRVEHPYTHAAPGGWAWTDLPGGVPDADDTPGALLALLALGAVDPETRVGRTARGCAGCSICKTATAAFRPFAAAGVRCPSTAAARI